MSVDIRLNDAQRCKIEQLYNDYHRLMIYSANRIVENSADAEDAAQQAFVSIAKNIGSLRLLDAEKEKALCCIIAERKALDLLRKKKKLADDALDDLQIGRITDFDGLNRLEEVLAKLPPRYREVLLLHYDLGYPTDEIARLYGIQTGSVNRLLSRARAALKNKMEIC